MANEPDRDVYFAAAPKEDIGSRLKEKLEKHRLDVDHPRIGLFRHAMHHYYGAGMGTSEVMRGGDEGELSEMRVAKARALAKSLLGILLAPKFAWRPQAANTDPEARAATVLAQQLLEYYWKRKWMNRYVARLAEQSIVLAEAYGFIEWDYTQGPELAPDPMTGRMIREGDAVFHNILPTDCIFDANYRSYETAPWRIITLYKNKWDVLAQYPEVWQGKTPLSGQSAKEAVFATTQELVDIRPVVTIPEDSDVVPVHYFFHDPSPSLPLGRMTTFVGGGCWLEDTILPDGINPVVRLAADELFGTPFAYSSWWDCLSLQELMDGLETALATNMLTLATQSVVMDSNTNAAPDSVHGMKVFYRVPGTKGVEPLMLSKSPPEAFAHLKQKASDQQQLVGLNDVFRGAPDTAQMNAQAFALLASQAIQQNSPYQAAVVDAVAQTGSTTLALLRSRVSTERLAAIAGKANRYLFTVRPFKGESLKLIDHVLVEIGNPVEQSAAGRFQLAQMHMNLGFVRTPEQLQQVLDTGRIEPATNAVRDELLLIAAENDDLAEGKTPPVHTFENHILHAKENASVLNNPEARSRPEVVEAVQAHLDMHYREYWGWSEPEMEPDPMAPPTLDPMTGMAQPAMRPVMEPDPLAPPDPMTGQPAMRMKMLPVQADPMFLPRLRILLGQQPPPPDLMQMQPPAPPDGNGAAGKGAVPIATGGPGDPTPLMGPGAGGGPQSVASQIRQPKNPLNGEPVSGAQASPISPPPV